MNVPDRHIIQKIDTLIHSNYSFAIYRLPWTDECTFVLQTNGEVEALNEITALNGKQGFVIAPFRISEKLPLILIHPTISATGWNAINQSLNSLKDIQTITQPESAYDKPVEYQEVFNRFILSLQKNKFRKLVLSRPETHLLTEEFSHLTAFVKACNSYPRMMIYLCHTPQTGTWLGSTPEI